jgi:hypothetical protein
MPCYEVNLISVEFQGKSLEILKKLGARISGDIAYLNGVEINLKTGKASAKDQESINKIKRLYSFETVKTLAKKKSWNIKTVGQKLTLTKW